MDNNEKVFVKKINIDKAKNKIITCIFLTIISLLSYVAPLMMGNFDFGIVFESLTLIFIFMARNYMLKYDEERSKKYTILAMIPIGWLLIYDFITIAVSALNVADFISSGADILIQEGVTILDLIILYKIDKDLRKAENPEKYKESTDWFFARLDEEDRK